MAGTNGGSRFETFINDGPMLTLTCFPTRSNLHFYKNGASHMTKLASMPVYHKPLKYFSILMRNAMVLKSGSNERGLEV